ncbi:uncharacterized protein LOC107220724 isoform X2 [Neodiprion lecontei]|uniref:Uncharacterized protein LOC107220724 isoform X2 n=1 Tax=Neodiprion lecontei TaxID=441921 RepID=A0ABM3G9N4_NEOLC|nr:uncharacterized protein LOC107220724 isoform X2 [Neodiprion lecontei]
MGKKAEIGETCAKRPIRRSKSAGSGLLRLILISLAGSARSLQQRTNANTVLPAAKGTTEGPLKISIGKTASSGSSNRVPEYVCPGNELLGLARIFSVPCETDSECVFLGADQRCCKFRCRKGVLAPPREPEHRGSDSVKRKLDREGKPARLKSGTWVGWQTVETCHAELEFRAGIRAMGFEPVRIATTSLRRRCATKVRRLHQPRFFCTYTRRNEIHVISIRYPVFEVRIKPNCVSL